MKTGISKFVWGLLVAAAGMFAAQAAMAGITGTAHDLSGAGYGTNQICIFCHTPHNSQTQEPLWNHAMTAATFQLYSSSTLNATMAQPGGLSKLCLSCHDGTVAIDSYGARTGSVLMTGSELIGTDLRNDPPVGFTYDAALATADGGLVTPASASLVVAGIPLYTAKMECSSCHNVHDNAISKFLRSTNNASALCLKCHNK